MLRRPKVYLWAGLALACFLALTVHAALAQEITNGPRFGELGRPAGCIREPLATIPQPTTVRICLYRGDISVMWTDQDAGAVQLAIDIGMGWVWSQDGLDLLNLNSDDQL